MNFVVPRRIRRFMKTPIGRVQPKRKNVFIPPVRTGGKRSRLPKHVIAAWYKSYCKDGLLLLGRNRENHTQIKRRARRALYKAFLAYKAKYLPKEATKKERKEFYWKCLREWKKHTGEKTGKTDVLQELRAEMGKLFENGGPLAPILHTTGQASVDPVAASAVQTPLTNEDKTVHISNDMHNPLVITSVEQMVEHFGQPDSALAQKVAQALEAGLPPAQP